jgi:hypothetical protein
MTLGGLSNVNIDSTSLEDGDIYFRYDPTTDKWTNQPSDFPEEIDGSILTDGTVSVGALDPDYVSSVNENITASATTLTQNYTNADNALENRLHTYCDNTVGTQVSIINGDINTLQNQITAISTAISSQMAGGINRVTNSSGLNGTKGWSTTGTVTTLQDSAAQDNTVSESLFKLVGTSGTATVLSQEIGLLRGQSYTFLCKAKRNTSARCYLTLNNSVRTETIFDATSVSDWATFSFTFTASGDFVEIKASSNGDSLYVADIMLLEGSWQPAFDEIYSDNVKIDKTGVVVNNVTNNTQTIIDDEQFAVKNQSNTVFTVNQSLTSMQKANVTDELTISKGRFVPHFDTNSNIVGLDFILLD